MCGTCSSPRLGLRLVPRLLVEWAPWCRPTVCASVWRLQCLPSGSRASVAQRQFWLWGAAHFQDFETVLTELGIFKFAFNVEWLFKKIDQ